MRHEHRFIPDAERKNRFWVCKNELGEQCTVSFPVIAGGDSVRADECCGGFGEEIKFFDTENLSQEIDSLFQKYAHEMVDVTLQPLKELCDLFKYLFFFVGIPLSLIVLGSFLSPVLLGLSWFCAVMIPIGGWVWIFSDVYGKGLRG